MLLVINLSFILHLARVVQSHFSCITISSQFARSLLCFAENEEWKRLQR